MDKIELLKNAIDNNDWEKALSIAVRYSYLAKKSISEKSKSIIRLAHETYKHPDFYQQLGKNIELLRKQGIDVLKEYYS